MKTNMKMKRTDEAQNLESCKLERLKMTGAYGSASQAEAWAEGIQARQMDIECAAVRKPKRRVSQ
jgi:hypothetical protein